MGPSLGRQDMALLFLTLLTLSLATSYSSPVTGNKVTCPEGWFDENDLDMGCLLMHSLEQKERIDQLVASEGYYYHWTGATDKDHEGDWVWGSTGGSGEPVQDFVWAPKQGNDGKLHNCMFWTWEMIHETQYLGGADDMCNILMGVYPLCQLV